jgi:hypothetical protein
MDSKDDSMALVDGGMITLLDQYSSSKPGSETYDLSESLVPQSLSNDKTVLK